MLFFRSEECVKEWCSARRVEPGPIIPIVQLWRLAYLWYSPRLDPDARQPQPSEVRGLFAGIGLTDAFWDPLA
jgi:hypothetical protein